MYFYVERCNETLQDNICQVYIREHGPITIEEVEKIPTDLTTF